MKKSSVFFAAAIVAAISTVAGLAAIAFTTSPDPANIVAVIALVVAGLAAVVVLMGKSLDIIWAEPAPTKAARPDNGKPDPCATRSWVEKAIDSKTSNCLRAGGEEVERIWAAIRQPEDFYYAWARVMQTGETCGWIAWGQPGGGYVPDTETLYSFTHGSGEGMGDRITSIGTPSPEAVAEWRDLSGKADWDYQCSGGSYFWTVPVQGIPFAPVSGVQLIASLSPETGAKLK